MADFDNEVESGVEQVSPEPEQQESESISSPDQGAQSLDDQKDIEQSVPYSRFKEINEQSKQYAAKLAEMEQKLAQLSQVRQEPARTQSQPKADPYAKVVERLQGIDPEFAEVIKHALKSASKVEELEAYRQQQSAEETRRQANNTMDKLFSEHKVPEGDQKFYRSMVRSMAMDDPSVRMEDLPKLFKSVHEDYTKHLDNIRRSERSKYVTDKSKDASKPTSQPKGNPTKGPQKKDLPVDREEAKAELIKNLMSKRRAATDI